MSSSFHVMKQATFWLERLPPHLSFGTRSAFDRVYLREDGTGQPAADSGGERASSKAAAKRGDNIPIGILYMVAATLLFAISSAIAKWQVAIYPVGEVMFFRSFSSLMVCVVFVLPFTGFSVFATRKTGA